MYGDYYRGSQWANTFYPNLMQVLGGYDQGALTDEPFVFDNLVKWGTDASQLHDMAVKYHVKYIVVEKTWSKWTDETWSKFLDERYFRPVSEVNDRLSLAMVFEVSDVKPIPPSELQYRYVYWNTWRLMGLLATLALSVVYSRFMGLSVVGVLKLPAEVKLPSIPAPRLLSINRYEALDLAVVSITTLIIAWVIGALTGFPKGVDAYCHLTKVRYLLKFWPNYQWNYLWYVGTPLFSGSYPPLSYYIVAAFTLAFRLTPERALITASALSFVINGLCMYGFVKNATGRRLASLLAALLMTFTPAYWEWWVAGGNYGRVISLGFFGLSLYLASLSAKRPESKLLKMFLFMSVAGAVCCHPVSGLPAIVGASMMLMLSSKSLRRGLVRVMELWIYVASLSAFYVTQFLFSNPTATGIFGKIHYSPTPVVRLFMPIAGHITSLHPLMVPLLLLAIVLVILRRSWEFFEEKIKPYIGCCAILLVASFGYAFVGHIPGYPDFLYINGFPPKSALCFVAISLPPFVSILLWWVIRITGSRKLAGITFLVLTISVVIVGSVVSVPSIKASVVDEMSQNTTETLTMSLIHVDPNDLNHRLGTDSAFVAIWFNYVYIVPQSRGYYAQGRPYPDWRSWFEHAVWFSENNYGETNFLLDWYAIRWVVVGDPHYKYQKFLQRPDLYKPVSKAGDWWEFEYLNASPILSATNAPSVLFIGSDTNYDLFLRAIALSNFNSRHIIPVKGPSEYVDDYTLEELQEFDCLFLYGYRYRDAGKAFSLLRQYVEAGGSVFFEANGSPDYNSPSLPEPFPVNDTVATSLGTEWDFTVAEDNVTRGIDFSKFSPPVYDGAPWGFSTTTSVRGWAKPVISTAGNPILVSGTYGSGKVVWSGMNLVYHIVSYRNVEESELLKNALLWLSGSPGPEPLYEVEFVNPQKRVVKIHSEARGVLFKENYFKQWRARIVYQDGSKEKLRIYLAGPGLMYIPIPEDASVPMTVVMSYHKLPQERAGDMISIVSLVLLVAYALLGSRFTVRKLCFK